MGDKPHRPHLRARARTKREEIEFFDGMMTAIMLMDFVLHPEKVTAIAEACEAIIHATQNQNHAEKADDVGSVS